MSATLTWASSGNAVKTNTTLAAYLDDLDTLVTSKSGDASFTWQTVGKNSSATSPGYIVFGPKGGGAGRILIVCWTSAPAGNNPAILDQAPVTNQLFICYFPNGTANTPSNLTASSGTIMGNDSGCTKVVSGNAFATAYGALFQTFYFDSPEGMIFAMANPASTSMYCFGAGNLVVDAADVAYPCSFGFGGNSIGAFGASSGAPMPWTAAIPLAGSASPALRTNYGATNSLFFMAFLPAVWASTVVGSTDILTDNSTNKAWFVPVPLAGQTKGQGFALKFRQFGWGPATTSAFSIYSTTGPVVAARCVNNGTPGGVGYPWVTNFKL